MSKYFLWFFIVAMLFVWAVPFPVLATGHIFDPDQVPADGKGTVYGKLYVRPHKDYVKKAREIAKNPPGKVDNYGISLPLDGSLKFAGPLLNYNLIKVFTVLVDPSAKLDEEEHEVEISEDDGMKPRALAVNKGDIIEIENESCKDLTFFLADNNSDDIQEFPTIASGDDAEFKVELVGDLELIADEDERYTMAVLSRQGLRSHNGRTGNLYIFKDLEPGE